jgi:hypothetical protein
MTCTLLGLGHGRGYGRRQGMVAHAGLVSGLVGCDGRAKHMSTERGGRLRCFQLSAFGYRLGLQEIDICYMSAAESVALGS